MRFISTLCLLLFFSVCFSQIDDLIRKSEYENTTIKIIPYICGFGRSSVSSLVDLPSLQGNMVRPKDSVLLKGLQIKVSGVYTRVTNNRDTAKKPETKIVIRCGNRYLNENPLIIVDGVPQDSAHLRTLNPNDIESIYIRKDATASAIYGCRASKGVILIITKQSKLRKFIIKDFLDGYRIPGATVSFISASKKDTIMVAANDSGVVITDKLKNTVGYDVKVSAIGYKLLNQDLKIRNKNEPQELLLEQDVKICKEVIINSGGHYHGCPKYYCISKISECSMQQISDTVYTFYNSLVVSNLSVQKVFPNPVRRGSTVTISTKALLAEQILVRLSDLSGKILFSQPQNIAKGLSRITFQTDPSWSTGIYFVQLYANGKLLASDKVVIQ
jgi:TonB-dependent SusC/RagA subfamily outer membrane receptor